MLAVSLYNRTIRVYSILCMVLLTDISAFFLGSEAQSGGLVVMETSGSKPTDASSPSSGGQGVNPPVGRATLPLQAPAGDLSWLCQLLGLPAIPGIPRLVA